MRPILSAVALALTAPAPAHACSVAAFFGESRPADGATDVPISTSIFIHAEYLTMGLTAELYHPYFESPIPLEVVEHAYEVIELRLPTLDPDLEYGISVDTAAALDGKSLSFRAGSAIDTSPPVQGSRLQLEERQSELYGCFDPNGWFVLASFDPAADDREVAAYVLHEIKGGEDLVHSAALAPRDGSAPQLRAWVGTELGEHCFYVEALDTSGNRSMGTMSCMNVGPKGPPGRTEDNGLLIEEAGGCACSAHESGSASPLLLIGPGLGARGLSLLWRALQ